MLTYDMSRADGPLYIYLYKCIRSGIESGELKAHEKMPSKRTFARNLGVSTVTVENAYGQLMEEGYIYSMPQRGYYVSDIGRAYRVPEVDEASAGGQADVLRRSGAEARTGGTAGAAMSVLTDAESRRAAGGTAEHPDVSSGGYEAEGPAEPDTWFDFSSGSMDQAHFPFSVWAKVGRKTISLREKDLLTPSPYNGIPELRRAIAEYLVSFRGMRVDPDQIIVGAGTEYLYGMLVKLLGRDKIYCIENPGYKKLLRIYESCGAVCRTARMDKNGILVGQLSACGAQVTHISPTHHFPTGITMPVTRRYELLAWANETEGRYIIEDDYDSEFRLTGSPIPSLRSLDTNGKVIYMNTFSKSLTSTIRISYMVLPRELMRRYERELSFYSCTVSNFEQYSLAAFIEEGYFEKHINRMRLYYSKKRMQVLDVISRSLGDDCHIYENSAGLHFMIMLKTRRSDAEVKDALRKHGIRIAPLSDYYMDGQPKTQHRFLINYSNMDVEKLKKAVEYLHM